MPAAAAFHRARKEKQAWEVEERQALLLAEKGTLAGDATEDLLAIDTRQHHGDEASSALPADLKQAPLGAVFYACPHCHAQKR